MSRSSRHKEKYGNGNEPSGVSTYEGTAARTRPISLEDILIRRKNKKLTEVIGGNKDPDCFSREDNVGNLVDDPKHDGGFRHDKESAYDNANKVSDEIVKRSSRKEEATSLKERSSVKGGEKEHLDLEKAKVDYEFGKVKERKNQKHNHHRTRNHETSQDNNENGKSDDRRKEGQSRHKSKIEGHLRDDDEPDKPRKRRSETQSHQRSRNEEHPRDENEAGKSKEQKNDKQSHHRSRDEHPWDENSTGKSDERKVEHHSHNKSRNEQHLRDDNETGKSRERKNESQSHHKSRNEDYLRNDNEIGKFKGRKNENLSQYRSRNEEHRRDDSETNRSKVRTNELQNHHKSRNEERLRGDHETSRMKEHNTGKPSHDRSRNEKRTRDDNETKRKHAEQLVGKNAFGDGERLKSEREGKRKYEGRNEGKDRSETDGSVIKDNESGKYNSGSAERKDERKDTSKSHYEGSGQKRRRSRSAEIRNRDRSVSLSPRSNKRTYNVQEHVESSLQSLNDKKQHSDDDRNRVSGNGGHASNHSWRHGGRGSRLGGYSPRKRRSEAAIKTPSPTSRSPERKNAGWDLPPTGTSRANTDIIPDFQLLNQIVSTEHKFSTVPLKSNVLGPQPGALPSTGSNAKGVLVDSVQLTHSTRPLRTLYVENLPASASDKSVMEFLNKLLLSSGANLVQGTQPCISCTLNKEKGQAVVEFLTAENATIALSFHGKSFASSILKIRRPKDFVDATTGDLEKSLPAADAISDIVKDSPHKIFVGGISKDLSSDMIMEIASAFGRLKAYRYVINDLKEPLVFLEYQDETRTPKACAGLNGMKLGGQILTVVQAVPDASVEETTEKLPSYGIPEHAKPLLSKPTNVLKLKNVFNVEELSSLLGSELEETLEDIRLECARFGTVKSINIVRSEISSVNANQTDEGKLQDLEGDSSTKRTEILEQDIDQMSTEEDASVNVKEPVPGGDFEEDTSRDDKPEEFVGEVVMSEVCHVDKAEEDCGEKVTTDHCHLDNKPVEDFGEKAMTEVSPLDGNFATNVPTCSDGNPQESPSQLDTSGDKVISGAGSNDIREINTDSTMTVEELVKEETNEGLQKGSVQLNNHVGVVSETSQREEIKQETGGEEVFEEGSVFVEYVRTESCCLAAHCLHGRSYGERTVTANYVPHDLYLSRFPK